MTTTNLFVIANVNQLRTGGSFRILLPFFWTSWGVGILNSAIFNCFHIRIQFGLILEVLRNFGGGVESSTPLVAPMIEWCVGNASSNNISYWSSITEVIGYGFSFVRFLDAPQSAGLLWTSDHLVTETCTWQHTTLTTDKIPCPRWDLNPRPQQESHRRPTS